MEMIDWRIDIIIHSLDIKRQNSSFNWAIQTVFIKTITGYQIFTDNKDIAEQQG